MTPMTTTLKEIQDEMMKKFERRCVGSMDGQTIAFVPLTREFLKDFALKVAEATRDAMMVEEAFIDYPDTDEGRRARYENMLYNSARQESLTRWSIFIGNNE